MDSIKAPSCPFESSLNQSHTVRISQVNWRGGVEIVIGISFLLDLSITWALRQVPVVLYSCTDQWRLENYCCGFNSQASERSFEGTIHFVIWGLCWKNQLGFLGDFYQTSQLPCYTVAAELSSERHSRQDPTSPPPRLLLGCNNPKMISPCDHC